MADKKRIIAIVGAALAAIVVIIAIIASVAITKSQEADAQRTIEERVEEVKQAYEDSGISLDATDLSIVDDDVVITSEEKAAQYKDSLNRQIQGMIDSLITGNGAVGSNGGDDGNGDGTDPSNPTPGGNIPDYIGSMIEAVDVRTNALRDLWNYFDSSKFVDMSNGITYQEEYEAMIEPIYQETLKYTEEQRALHPEMSEEEFGEWIVKDLMQNDTLPHTPEYDTSRDDVKRDQVQKAYGLVSFLGLPAKWSDDGRRQYMNAFGKYVYDGQIDHENQWFASSNYKNGTLFKELLTSQAYLNTIEFDSSAVILNADTSNSYMDGMLTSFLTLTCGGYKAIYAYTGGSMALLDIVPA